MTTDIEKHLVHAQNGVRELREKVNTLERENSRLRSALKDLKLIPRCTTDDDTNLEELNLRESKKEALLMQSNKRWKKKIKHVSWVMMYLRRRPVSAPYPQLQKRLLLEEVANLQTEKVTDEEIDPFYRMQKVRTLAFLLLACCTSYFSCSEGFPTSC